ncbi:hypothetical protein MNEG_9168, partial [Monoraphidium neglectum]
MSGCDMADDVQRLERIPTTIHKTARAASAAVAAEIAALIRGRAAEGKKARARPARAA